MTLEALHREFIAAQTTITIPVDLSEVRTLEPGDDWAAMADSDSCEVYVVTRDDGRVTVHAFSVRADRLSISADNLP